MSYLYANKATLNRVAFFLIKGFFMFKITAMSDSIVSSGVRDNYTGFEIRTTINVRKQFRELIQQGRIPKYKDMKFSNEELSRIIADIFNRSIVSIKEQGTSGGDLHYFPSKKSNNLIEIRKSFSPSTFKSFFTVMRGGYADIITISDHYTVKKTRSREYFKSNEKYKGIQH